MQDLSFETTELAKWLREGLALASVGAFSVTVLMWVDMVRGVVGA